jgi:acyl CoA:acetate/3-ketoacid CoA transferase alpha subunit
MAMAAKLVIAELHVIVTLGIIPPDAVKIPL